MKCWAMWGSVPRRLFYRVTQWWLWQLATYVSIPTSNEILTFYPFFSYPPPSRHSFSSPFSLCVWLSSIFLCQEQWINHMNLCVTALPSLCSKNCPGHLCSPARQRKMFSRSSVAACCKCNGTVRICVLISECVRWQWQFSVQQSLWVYSFDLKRQWLHVWYFQLW